MATIYNRIRNGMTNATEGDVTHLDTDFVSGAGVGDLTYDGITTQNTGSDRNILVTGGIFYVKNSAAYTRNQSVQKYRSYEIHDTTVTVAVTPNTTLATRIDYLCLKDDTAATPDANASNTGSFVMVEGTVNNTAPAIPDNHLVLARLDLAQNFSGVTNAMITDMRVVATLANKDGWTLIDESEDPLAVGGTLAIVQYVSATSIKIYGDWTKFIGRGAWLKLYNSSTWKYQKVTTNGVFSAGYTTYTVNGGNISTISNSSITKVYYSYSYSPQGAPDPETYLYLPQGTLVNGRISVSVASNNITVAIKGIDGNDPSTENPVYIRIQDSVRRISAALSVTKNAGTNWFSSGTTGLATQEIDYFVYLGYNATDGVVIGFARFPSAHQYSDFSTTSTNEKYCAISTITNAASTDYYNVVGRFAATLSATASFNWSVPTFTASNLIQKPIYRTRALTFTPTATGFSGSPTNSCTYWIIENEIKAIFSTSSTTSNATTFTLTVPFAAVGQGTFILRVLNNGTWGAGLCAWTTNLTLYADVGANAFTASGNKGLDNGNMFVRIS